MKAGIGKGYNSGCCDGLEVWGVSIDAPNFHMPGGVEDKVQSYDLKYTLREDFTGEYHHELSPELWARAVNQEWYLYAAKVPGTYPGPAGEDTNRPISSRASGDWSVEVCSAARHQVMAPSETQAANKVSMCKGSRAIYIDGQQAYLTYRTSGWFTEWSPIGGEEALPFLVQNEFQGSGANVNGFGDHHLISIGAQSLIGTYNVQYLAGRGDNPDDSGLTAMEHVFMADFYPRGINSFHKNILNLVPDSTSVAIARQYACNTYSFGRYYFIMSSYRPGKDTWSVARVEYDGLGVFCTEIDTEEKLGNTEVSRTGNYWIVMPAVRTYIDSSVDSPEDPDECWVCALHKSGSTPEIITSRWLSSIYHPGGSDPDADFADGTLSSSEVSAGNTILDTSDSELTSRYPEESWDHLQIRCYNRIYDPTTGHSRDLLLFTTHDDEDTETIEDIIADFEGGDLDSGLEDAEISFTTGGFNETDGWVSSTTDPDEGSYSARTTFQDVTVVDDVFLSITFQVVSGGYVTFRYRHDNRKYGTRIPPFTELTNLPEPDNYLDIRLDGALLTESGSFQIDDVNQSTSRIDNVTVPDNFSSESEYLTWRTCKVLVPAGTHTLTWTLHREWQDNGHLVSQIDYVTFPELMVGEDTTSKRRWLFNGTNVQKAEWWAWPANDEESETALTDRGSTAPDFITLDKTGRILYGNPHYVVRLIPNEDDAGYYKLDTGFGTFRGPGWGSGHNGGYLRFTASPFVQRSQVGETEPGCDAPDPEYTTTDVVADPPWGAFQIMPIGAGGDFQVRGANASLRDATNYPFPEETYPYQHPVTGETLYETFRDRSYVREMVYWSQRCSSWTITGDGKVLRPHVEIVWRPTRFTMAYPPGPWPHPPWQSFFTTADSDAFWGHAAMRPRDKLRLSEGSILPRWSNDSYIIPATFTDALMRFPQAIWRRAIGNDPPDDEEDPNWYDPDWDDEFGFGPWPSAKWQLVLARMIPVGACWVYYTGPNDEITLVDETCADPGDPETPQYSTVFRALTISTGGLSRIIPTTDFEAVDEQPVCCE